MPKPLSQAPASLEPGAGGDGASQRWAARARGYDAVGAPDAAARNRLKA